MKDQWRGPRPSRRLSAADRLQKYTDRSGGPDSCWTWTGHRNVYGYGRMHVIIDDQTRYFGAHRVAYMEANGYDLPSDVFILHSCHNPPCCNPAHLRAGTHVENMADRLNEGAGYARGSEHPNAIDVSDEVIAAIRADYRPHVKGRGQHALARRYGISRSEIQRIVTRSDRWAESA